MQKKVAYSACSGRDFLILLTLTVGFNLYVNLFPLLLEVFKHSVQHSVTLLNGLVVKLNKNSSIM